MIDINKSKRKEIKKANGMLCNAISVIERVKEDEEESLNNMPENLERSERYAAMENAVDVLEECMDKIEEAKNNLEEII